MSEIKGCMNCGNISCGNNKQRRVDGCGRWKSPEQKIIELEGDRSQREKAIIELSREFNRRIAEYEKRIAEFKKENAELKEKLKPENCLKLLAKEGYIKFTSEQLTKAKELLKRCYDNYIYLQPLRGDIEQFLNSEVEKNEEVQD